MVARLGRSTDGGACASPCIDEEAAKVGLIACSSKQGSHLRLGAKACAALVVMIVDIDEFRTYVESLEASTLIACKEELMAIA